MRNTSFKSTKGNVSSAHPLASKAGVATLEKGGNAFDCIAVTSLTLSALLPPFSGIGGGGFAMIHIASSKKTLALDYREKAPGKAKPDMFELEPDGISVKDSANSQGQLAVAVPGTIKGLSVLLGKFGNFSLEEALQIAVEYASKGTSITPALNRATSMNLVKLSRFPYSSDLFLKKLNNNRTTNEKVIFSDLISTYRELARRGAVDDFYHGEISSDIISFMEQEGGILSKNDFKSYEPLLREPVFSEFLGWDLALMPLPSAGGVQIAQAVQLIEEKFSDKQAWRKISSRFSAEYVDFIAQVMGATFEDKQNYATDPAFHDVDIRELVSMRHVSKLARSMGSIGKKPSGTGGHDLGRSTTHMCAIDKERNVVSLTESVECFYGSGVSIPGRGILMNDTMHDFDPRPSALNNIQPGKIPVSSMSPTIVFDDRGRPYATLGSAGGPRIVTAVLQTLVNLLAFKDGIAQAVAAPRVHFQGRGLLMETRIAKSVQKKLAHMGYELELAGKVDLALGGVQAIEVVGKNLHGTADPRRDGKAAGY